MSRAAKVCFMVSLLLIVGTLVLRFVVGSWINLNTVILGVAAGVGVAAVFFDRRMYWEFLTMRTTKYGMNMGLGILLVLILLVCANYLAGRYDKTWDLTAEKLNSLSEHSVQVVKSLKDNVEILVFTRGNEAQQNRQVIKQSLQLFQDLSHQLKVRYVNPYVDSDMAMKYLNDLPDRDLEDSFVFMERGAKRIRVDRPFDEAAVVSALIKLTRASEAKIYFLKGHGEKDIDAEGGQSLKDLVKLLTDSSFQTATLNLLDKPEIPADATILAIVGPSLPYLETELDLLRTYLKAGGRLFIALDPGQRHNLANLTKSVGVEFPNNFIMTMQPLESNGPALIAGREFDQGSAITRSFPLGSSYSLFYLASEIRPAPDKPATIQFSELVRTDSSTFTMNDLKLPLKQRPETKSVLLAASVKGTFVDTPTAKPFEVVIFGDSDFLINQILYNGVNRDLALNAFAHLSNQAELISIRPKLPAGTSVVLTATSTLLLVMFVIGLPLILLMSSGVMWFRRRGA